VFIVTLIWVYALLRLSCIAAAIRLENVHLIHCLLYVDSCISCMPTVVCSEYIGWSELWQESQERKLTCHLKLLFNSDESDKLCTENDDII
jgi:hypothetical protein